jgi:hypothetical protein
MHDSEILIRPDAVRAALDEYTEIAAGLEQMARQLNEAMAEGRAGDAEGFIAEGLADGDAAAQSFRMAAAMLRDLIADTHATMDAIERVDGALTLPDAAAPAAASVGVTTPAAPPDDGAWGVVHGALDGLGFIPKLGAVPDLINAGIYAARGKHDDARMSAIAAIP